MSFNREQATTRGSGTNTFNIPAFGATPTAGNTLVLLLSWVANGSNNVDINITDNTSAALTWHKAVTSPNNTGSRTCIAYAFNIPTLSSNPTITITRQGGVTTVLQGSAEEWSGFGANDPLSATASRSQNSTSSATSNTTAAIGELDAVVFAVVHEGLVSQSITVETVTPAWTQVWDASINGVRGEADYKVVTGGGTQICRWTFGGATDYSASIAAFVSGNTPSIERVNQAVRTTVSTLPPSPLLANQVVRTKVSQAAPVLKLNQVVLTLIVIPTVECPDAPTITDAGEGADAVTPATPDTAPICGGGAVRFPNYGDGLQRPADYLDPAQDWTRALWVLYPAEADYYANWSFRGRDHDAPPATTPGPNGDPVIESLGVITGGVFTQKLHISVLEVDSVVSYPTVAGVWRHVTARYRASVPALDLFLDGAQVATGSPTSLASSSLAGGVDRLGIDGTAFCVPGASYGYDGVWQAALTDAQILAQVSRPTPITQTNLLRFEVFAPLVSPT